MMRAPTSVLWVFFTLCALCFSPPSAQAQVYGELSYSTITKTLLRFRALDLTQQAALDDYLKINHCDDYKKAYADDFALQRLREKTLKAATAGTEQYPDTFYFKAPMYLDRYDFATRVFKLTKGSQLRNINSFLLTSLRQNEVCVTGERLNVLPAEIGAVLDQPVTLEGLPINEGRAQKLIKAMNDAGNTGRAIYARISLMISFAPPLADRKEKGARYNMDAQLLMIEFFEDKEFKKPIWVFSRG